VVAALLSCHEALPAQILVLIGLQAQLGQVPELTRSR
jgi:hypothetical protein